MAFAKKKVGWLEKPTMFPAGYGLGFDPMLWEQLEDSEFWKTLEKWLCGGGLSLSREFHEPVGRMEKKTQSSDSK
jgi:hypothetical protein